MRCAQLNVNSTTLSRPPTATPGPHPPADPFHSYANRPTPPPPDSGQGSATATSGNPDRCDRLRSTIGRTAEQARHRPIVGRRLWKARLRVSVVGHHHRRAPRPCAMAGDGPNPKGRRDCPLRPVRSWLAAPLVDAAVVGGEAVVDSPEDRLGATCYRGLAVDPADIGLHGVGAQVGQGGDVGVAFALRDQREYFRFTVGEPFTAAGQFEPSALGARGGGSLTTTFPACTASNASTSSPPAALWTGNRGRRAGGRR